MIQALSQKIQLLQTNHELVEQKTRETIILNQQVTIKDELIESQQEQIGSLQEQIGCMGRQIESQQAKIADLQRELQRVSEGKPHSTDVGNMVHSLNWPLSLQWRNGNVMPKGMLRAHTVTVNGMVYCGGNNTSFAGVLQYNPENGEWTMLPEAPVVGFAMASLSDQLVLVGNHLEGDKQRITVWDSGHNKWPHPYPPMPTGRSLSAAVGYKNYLIVACGFSYIDKVEVLDSSSGRWYSAQPVPMAGNAMSSAVVGDHWYLSSYGFWLDGKEHTFCANLPTLISSAMSVDTSTASIWHELPTPPVQIPTLLALHGHLLLIGGVGCVQQLHRYDTETKQWKECGQLPVAMGAPCCTILPSGEMMVAVGITKDARTFSKKVWIGKI